MSARSPSARTAAAVVGFLTGGAAGFLLTEIVSAFFESVLDRALDTGDSGLLLAAFVVVPAICAVLGAVVAARRAGSNSRPHHRGW